MWQLQYISAENFMSFEKVEYQFENKCYVVRAENKDNDGQQSNGGGKTSFVDIIAIALLGYSLTGRNVKDCVNWNSDQNYFIVKLYLENPQHKINCFIERKVYSNTKGQELVLLVNEKLPSTLPTKKGAEGAVDVKAGNTYILKEILDITEQDLLSYHLISKTYYQPFLNVNTDRKLEVISRFSRADVIDKVIKNLELDLEVGNDSVEEYKLQIAKIQGHIEALSQSLEGNAKVEFEQQKQKQIEQKEIRMKYLSDRAHLLAQQGEEIKTKIQSLVPEELDPQIKIDLNTRLKSLNTKEFIELEREINKEISEIKNYLAGLITCPECFHKFHLTSKKRYDTKILTQREAALADVQSERVSAEKAIEEIKEDIAIVEEIERSNFLINNQRIDLEQRFQSLERESADLLNDMEAVAQQIDAIAAHTFADEKVNIHSNIKEKEGELITQQQQLEQQQKQLTDIIKWIDYFSDFKFYLGNKPIEAICSLVNQYLRLNGSDLNLHIEGFKKLRSGEMRQALTPVIYRNWMNPQSVNQFSEGERVRLNLAVDLAFQQLINQSSKTGGLNFYVNDELLNPLDSLGVANAARAFNQLDKTILLVSHSGADLVYNNTILIEKKNQISTVI